MDIESVVGADISQIYVESRGRVDRMDSWLPLHTEQVSHGIQIIGET